MFKRILLALAFTFMVGCAAPQPTAIDQFLNQTQQEEVCNCPSEDVIIIVNDGQRQMFVPIPKNSLCDPDNYMTEEQYLDFMKKMQERSSIPWDEKLNKGGI